MKAFYRKSILVASYCLMLSVPGFPETSEPVSRLFTIEYFGDTVGIPLTPDSFKCVKHYNNRSRSNDLIFFMDSIYCPYGITTVPELEEELNFAISGTISHDPRTLFYYDNRIRKVALQAPANGYKTAVPINKKVYFIRTPDGGYCALLRIGEYISAIDRINYYQVVSKEARLYKISLYEVPDYADISAMFVFSGRPDPVFRLTDRVALNRLILFINNATNYLEDPTLVIENPEPVNPTFGTPLFVINYPYKSCDSIEEKSVIKVGYGRIEVEYQSNTRTFTDRSKQLEKLIYDVGRGANLVSSDSSLSFNTLFPDSSGKVIPHNIDNWSSLMTVNNNLDSGIASITGSVKNSEYCMFVAAGDSGVYSLTYTLHQNQVISNSMKKPEGLQNKKIISLTLKDSVLYAGSQTDGVFRKVKDGDWESFSDGLPTLPVDAIVYGAVTEMVFEDSLIFTFVSVYDKNELYCRHLSDDKWVDALKKYGVNKSTPLTDLPDNLPFSVRRCLLLWKDLKSTDDNTLFEVAKDDTVNSWKIMNIVKSGSFLTAITFFRYNLPESKNNLNKALFVSADGGITWKMTLNQLIAPVIKIAQVGDTLFCGIPGERYNPISSVKKLLPNLYVSFDNGNTWNESNTGVPANDLSFFGAVGNQLCVAAKDGEIFVANVSNYTTRIERAPDQVVRTASRILMIRCGSKSIKIRIPATDNYSNISIFNVQGKLIKEIKGDLKLTSQVKIPLSGSGVYLLKAASKENLYVQRFVIK